MNVEDIFRKTKLFENLEMDFVLVESKYPVLFTCKDRTEIYLFVCCLVNSKVAKWIGTKTNYETLISLLENGITIREAFWGVCEEKIVIEYNASEKKVYCENVNKKEIPEVFLPTSGEYMDAEDGEFEEEINVFKMRASVKEVIIKPQINRFLYISINKQEIALPDEYFAREEKPGDEISFGGVPCYKMNVAYA